MQTWSFRGGVWHEGEAEGADFAWFDITGSEDPGLDQLAERFHLHHLAVEDCRSLLAHAPKIDDFGDYLFLVLHAVVETPGGRETDEVDVFLSKNFLITYQDRPIKLPGPNGEQPASAALIAALQSGIGVRPGPDGALYELADRIVDGILPRVNALAEQLDAIHDEILVTGSAREQHH
ncbi:MAG: CorA family divalent cation transporter, partial [Anaerolineaceae bacterium]